ncbi:MAG: HsdM family class I SAM-dependent methyltransferase, partial [Candidatus Binatia bacterium]
MNSVLLDRAPAGASLQALRVTAARLKRTSGPADAGHARAVCACVLAEFLRSSGATTFEWIKSDSSMRREMIAYGTLNSAADFGRGAATLPRPLAAYLISSLYTSLLPSKIRSELGMFFTPPALVERLLDLAENAGVDWTSARIIDPACGGGAFLAPVAGRIIRTMLGNGAAAADIVQHLETHLMGIEIDVFAAEMARAFLLLEVANLCPHQPLDFHQLLKVDDTLRTENGWAGQFDLVIGNPPYGRVSLPQRIRARYARSIHGHANLYALFTELGVRLARPDGLIAYVTPSSFLGGRYFCNLRRMLSEEAPPVSVDFVTDRSGVFDDVLQETMLTVFQKTRFSRPISVSFCRPASLDEPCKIATVGLFPQVDKSVDPWLLPRRADHVSLLKRAGTLHNRLANYGFAVSTGPLVWNRHKPQLRNHPGERTFPLIWAEAVLRDGTFAFSAERRGHQPYFHVLEGQEHLVVRRPCILVKRTTAIEESRRVVAAKLPQALTKVYGGVVVENHLN